MYVPCDDTGMPTEGTALRGYVPGAIFGGELSEAACSSLASLLSLDLLF